MRLWTLLVLSHAVLVAILALGLAVALGALRRIDGLLGQVREQELGALGETEELYRAGWAVEVAARHATDLCDEGNGDAHAVDEVAPASRALRATIARHGARAERRVRSIIDRYARFADELLADAAPCARLHSAAARRERLRLDEELTDVWIARLYELHNAIYLSEEQARATDARALRTGVLLLVAAALCAALLTWLVARGVTAPLDALARAARRVGRGDFSPPPVAEARGPAEVRELSRELDGMRAHLAELDALKQGFVASVSHELRTPLATLREALSLLGDEAAGPLSARQREVVAIARGACEREIHIVTTLLDLSRLRAGGPLKLEPDRALDDVVRDAAESERPAAEARRVAIELVAAPPEGASGSSPRATLDAALLERAVANLLRNAVSVSPAGARVAVSRETLDRGPDGEPGEWACVRVTDAGPGVPPAIRPNLFDPFFTFRVHTAAQPAAGSDRAGLGGGLGASRGPGGVGLGLPLAREVARAHGGDVRLADDGPGPGATFELWLPLGATAAARAPATPTMPPPPPPRDDDDDDDDDGVASARARSKESHGERARE